MSGHSKWATIKRQKAVADSRRGQLFTKLGREVTIAARQGGGDPEANFRLRLAIQRARDNNMPLENIERAIKRGTGEAEGLALAEVAYEAYGPGGIAIMVEAMTDNRNRTLSDVRNVFTRHGGSLGESGCVSWLFEPRGVLALDVDRERAEEVALQAIDVGADDVKVEDGSVEVYTRPEDLETVRRKLEESEIKVSSAELSKVPKTTIRLEEKAALQALKLLDKLEELDDVQHLFTNADFPNEVLERLKSSA